MDRNILEALMKDRLHPFDLFYIPSYEVLISCCEWSAIQNHDVIAILNIHLSSKESELINQFVHRQRLGIHILVLNMNLPLIHFTKHVLFIPHKRIRKAHDRSKVVSSDGQYVIDGINVENLGTIDQLPKILITDPACNWYGFRSGDLIEIMIGDKSEVRLVIYKH